MDVIDKAKELGAMIAASGEMQSLKKAEAEVESDQKAKTLFNDYKLLQLEVMKANREKRSQDIIDSIKERLAEKQKEINEYPVTMNYMEAKNKFDSFMKEINNVIIFCITGEEPCSPSKCGSCGGGCK